MRVTSTARPVMLHAGKDPSAQQLRRLLESAGFTVRVCDLKVSCPPTRLKRPQNSLSPRLPKRQAPISCSTVNTLLLCLHHGCDPTCTVPPSDSSRRRRDERTSRNSYDTLTWTPARDAWERHRSILSPVGRTTTAIRLLDLVIEHSHESYTVPSLSLAMAIGIRQLSRLCLEWFTITPGILVDLARIVSVAREVADTDKSLKSIAYGHGFTARCTMARQFLRFIGIPPLQYRRSRGPEPMSESAPRMSETVPFPTPRHRGI
jgi:AraC-like DNA-binding protein